MSARARLSLSRALGASAAIALAIITVAVSPLPGCYRPSIKDGGFLCAAPPAKACPDGFRCLGGVCLSGSDGGGVDGMCTSGPVQPICDDQPGPGQQCNPACQTGCACGRCNVVDGAAVCTPAGTQALGAKCNPNPGSDDCAAGLICLEETCGNRLGRCYRHC